MSLSFLGNHKYSMPPTDAVPEEGVPPADEEDGAGGADEGAGGDANGEGEEGEEGEDARPKKVRVSRGFTVMKPKKTDSKNICVYTALPFDVSRHADNVALRFIRGILRQSADRRSLWMVGAPCA